MHHGCRKCGYVRTPKDSAPDYACPKCGAVYAKVEEAWARGESQRLEDARVIHQARNTGDWRAVPAAVIQQLASEVVVVTLTAMPGRRIQEVRGLVFGDHAIAFGALREAVTGVLRNIGGTGASPDTVAFLAQARAEALLQLRLAAVNVGADSVVGCRVDYEEISGANGHGVLIACASGTAICTEALQVT